MAVDRARAEAAVRELVSSVGPGKCPYESVGENHAADEIGGKRRVYELPDWPLHEVAPVRFADHGARVARPQQRLRHRRKDPAGKSAGSLVELRPCRRIRACPNGGEGSSGRFRVLGVDEQRSRWALRIRGEGRVSAPAQFKAQAQFLSQHRGHERDQVGVAAQPGVNAGKDLR